MSKLKKSVEHTREVVERSNNRFNVWWKFLLYGALQGVGAMVGVFFVIILVGWILNIIGVIPYFKDFTEDLRIILQEVRRY